MSNLSGKRAVVTGGAGGVGIACAEGLAKAGADVVICDLMEDACNDAASALAEKGATVSWSAFDVADRAAVEAAFAEQEAKGGVDILVASAAIVKPSPIIDFDYDDWKKILDINLTGTFNCCQLAGRQMVKKGGGRIITISSVNGQIANSNRGAYSCTKGGVDMLTRLLAAELGKHGITANTVSPAPVDTAMIQKAHGPKDRQRWYDQMPIKRYAQPEEVASCVCFLASDEAAYVNGHILNLDGGFMASGILLD